MAQPEFARRIAVAPGTLSSMEYRSHHHWSHNGVQYEVNSFHHSEADAWCYELYRLAGEPGRNDYIEVRIPDVTPDGPFTPAPAAEAVFMAHGEPVIPWPVVRQFLDLIQKYGDLVEGPADRSSARPGAASDVTGSSPVAPTTSS
ncbi:MAG TPA: hypothetical protein VFN97_13190 [Actinospica sp.]|nr:hypothetical protein [Actinospica sp.]